MSSLRLGKGGTQATWDLIYMSRRQILFASPDKDSTNLWTKINGTLTKNSNTILEFLLREGRLPGYAVHNFNSVAPFRDLEVHDNGNDLSLSVRLPKGGDIKEVLATLGGRLRSYVDKFPAGEVSNEELQHLVDCAHAEALAANREEGGHAPDLKRAFGLWLWDWQYSHPEAKDLRKGYVELLAFYHRLFTPEKNADLPAPTNKRELQKYVKRTEACIQAGKSLPFSS